MSGTPARSPRTRSRLILIEYGSGTGIKTRSCSTHLEPPAAYVPIDISCEQLAGSPTARRSLSGLW